MQRLGAAEHRRQALHGHPDDVVERLLGGELDPGRLGVEAQHPRARLGGPEPGGHGVGPDAAGRPELGRLLEQGRPGHEEEGQPGRERVHGQPGVHRRLHVGDGVGQGEGDLLDGGRPGLGHVVAGDGDGVEAGQVLGAVGEQVGGDPQRRRRRVDVGAAGDVLLEHVVLDRAGEGGRVDPLLLPDELVEEQQAGRRGVDGHGGGDLVEGDALEQPPHVGQRVDRHPDLADLAGGHRVVGVVAHLGGQVEGDAEAGLAVVEQVAEAGVGLGGRPEAGVLAHRPGPAPVHGRVDAAGERVAPRLPQGGLGVEAGEVGGPVGHLDRDARFGVPLVAVAHGQTSRRWSSAYPLVVPTVTNGPRRRSREWDADTKAQDPGPGRARAVRRGRAAAAGALRARPQQPSVTQDAPWPDGRAGSSPRRPVTRLAFICVAIEGACEATPHRLCVIWPMLPLDILPQHPHPRATDRSRRTTRRTTATGRPSWRVRSGT